MSGNVPTREEVDLLAQAVDSLADSVEKLLKIAEVQHARIKALEDGGAA
jgi:hypothetical protein